MSEHDFCKGYWQIRDLSFNEISKFCEEDGERLCAGAGRRPGEEALWQRRCRSRHTKDEADQSWEWSTVNDDLKRTPTLPPRRLLRATCSKRQPQGVTTETATLASLDSHVSVTHNMSRSCRVARVCHYARALT